MERSEETRYRLMDSALGGKGDNTLYSVGDAQKRYDLLVNEGREVTIREINTAITEQEISGWLLRQKANGS